MEFICRSWTPGPLGPTPGAAEGTEPELPPEEGVGGGMMAVIMEAEDGEAISEATGVTDPEAGLRSPPVHVDRELATLRLINTLVLG